jgi:hypothetical protein
MLVKRLLQFNLIVSCIIALAFIILPGSALTLYGLGNERATITLAQYFGSTHVAFAVLVWVALKSSQRSLLRAVVVSFFAGDLIGTGILLAAQLRGTMNVMGWGFVGLSAFFALAYGYCALKGLPRSA